MLTLISTQLATLRRQPSGAGSRGSSSALSRTTSALPEEVRQWAVDWETIQLERLIGKGSYGRVCECPPGGWARHAFPGCGGLGAGPCGAGMRA